MEKKNLDTFIVITWPESQLLMELTGFEENSSLLNDYPLMDEFGTGAYFVRLSWIEETNE